MDDARASLVEGKRNMVVLTERAQSLQSELDQSELKREEVEAELNNTQEVKKMDHLPSSRLQKKNIAACKAIKVKKYPNTVAHKHSLCI